MIKFYLNSLKGYARKTAFLVLDNKLCRCIKNIDTERNYLVKLFTQINMTSATRILDVGCGYGKNMILLKSLGFNALGVDINEGIVQKNIERGLNSITLERFKNTGGIYDVIIMSHIIEHFNPVDLLEFMDFYLSHLENGGYLIIATPLQSPYFYDDFDHIKPYHPSGFTAVFGGNSAQVQFYSKNTLKLVKLFYRRGQLRFKTNPMRNGGILLISELIFAIVYWVSFGIIARIDGWVGLFKKV